MPTINVAPIYSDAWQKDWYEGQAIIVEESLRSVETTLLGVTCRLYWVRFFYTEINLSRWVEVSSIEEWTDTERRSIPCSSISDKTLLRGYATQLRQLMSTVGGKLWTYYVDMPHLSSEDQIIALGCEFSIPILSQPSSYVRIDIFSHDSTTPDDTYDTLASKQLSTQSDTYIPLQHTIPSPIIVADHPSLSMRLRFYEDVTGGNTYYMWMKEIYIDTLRLI